MRTSRIIHAVDSHTEGMPTRVVTGGIGVFPGATMAERRQWFIEHNDELRTLLMCEPRGHASMSGSILQPPTRPDADFGVLFTDVALPGRMNGAELAERARELRPEMPIVYVSGRYKLSEISPLVPRSSRTSRCC